MIGACRPWRGSPLTHHGGEPKLESSRALRDLSEQHLSGQDLSGQLSRGDMEMASQHM